MLEKRLFGYMDYDSSDKDLPQGAVREIHNMVHINDGFGNNPRLETILGTKEINVTMPAGTNKTIGLIEDIEGGVIYFFNYNSNGDHGIYEYNGYNASRLIESTYFPFTKNSFIRGSIVDGMMFFTDNLSLPMYINVPFAKIASGNTDAYGLPGYKDLSLREYLYLRPRANYTPVVARANDENVIRNKVSEDSYKFAYRYIYFDNGISRLSHFSKLVPADLVAPASTTTFNTIQIRFGIDPEIEHLVKEVQLFYQKNSSPAIYQFHREKRPKTDDGWRIATNYLNHYIYKFDGSETATLLPVTEYKDQFDNYPRLTSDMIINHNRLLLNKGLQGYTDFGSPDIGIFQTQVQTGAGLSLKHGGIYSGGIVYEDAYGWLSPVQAKKSIHVRWTNSASGSERGLKVGIVGTPPEWAVKWHFVVSAEDYYEQYEEFPVYVLLSPTKANNSVTNGGYIPGDSGVFFLNGYGYYNTEASIANGTITTNGVTAIHLRMPENLPFYPEKGMFGRFKDQGMLIYPELNKEFVVLDVVGDLIYIDTMGLTVQDWFVVGRDYVNIEIYTKKDNPDGKFQEVGISGNCISGSHAGNSFVWKGDQFYIDTNTEDRMNFIFPVEPVIAQQRQEGCYGKPMPYEHNTKFYSPTPAAGGSIIAEQGVNQVIDGSLVVNAAIKRSYTMDYAKIANDRSNPHVEGDIEEQRREDLMLWSDPYIPGTKVNGLFNISADSEKALGAEDGGVVRLRSIGDRTVIAIQRHSFTSMYMGQGVLRAVDGEEIVTDSDNVIGYSNRAKRRHGTQHPESLAEWDDVCYVWDASRGEIVRYAQNGVEPLGAPNEFKGWLKLQADTRRNSTNYKVYGMFNPEHETYVLCFADASFGQISLPPVTIVYSARAGKFTMFLDIYPEIGHKFQDKMVVAKSGKLWKWNYSGYRFFSKDYYPKVVMVFNSMTEVEKFATAITIDSDQPWQMEIESSTGSKSITYSDEFIQYEKNKHSGDIYRDILSLGAYPDSGAGEARTRFDGDTIRGEYFIVTLTRPEAGAVKLTEVMLSMKPLTGHQTTPQ